MSSSPANDFANLAPRQITFRTGGFITGIIGILMMPWKLFADPSGYIFTWLIGYSALLGPIGGIMIADYFVYRKAPARRRRALRSGRAISLHRRLQLVALIALVLAVLPNLPGFLVTIKVLPPDVGPADLPFALSLCLVRRLRLAFVFYLALRKLTG